MRLTAFPRLAAAAGGSVGGGGGGAGVGVGVDRVGCTAMGVGGVGFIFGKSGLHSHGAPDLTGERTALRGGTN